MTNEHNFKVGDKVRVVRLYNDGSGHEYMAMTGEVIIVGEKRCRIFNGLIEVSLPKYMLEIIEPNTKNYDINPQENQELFRGISMREQLTEKEIARLNEVGFTKADGLAVQTLGDLLETIPDAVEVFRYRPQQRWENMSDPTYWLWLSIDKDDEEKVWQASYERATFSNPNLCLDYKETELIEALFNLAVAYATAPSEWIDKSNSVYRMLGESEEDYQERLKRIKED